MKKKAHALPDPSNNFSLSLSLSRFSPKIQFSLISLALALFSILVLLLLLLDSVTQQLLRTEKAKKMRRRVKGRKVERNC
jgi:hypothetical protein